MTPELQLPSNEEIEAAWRAIDTDGPQAHSTMALSIVGLRNARLSSAVRRMTEVFTRALAVESPKDGIAQSLVMAALVTGLNYGLRIGAARVAAATKAVEHGQ